MQPVADIVIPIAPYHADVWHIACNSAEKQSAPVNVIYGFDKDRRGAAFMRNQLAAQGSAPFIVFLDADDMLDPFFVDHCVRAYKRGSYVYTGWYAGEVNDATLRSPLPCENGSFYDRGLFHTVTTLLPRKAFQMVGGFDAGVNPEAEDFYYRINLLGLCPVHVNKPLLYYRYNRGHSLLNPRHHGTPRHRQLVIQYHQQMQHKYRMLEERGMGCCGSAAPTPQMRQINERREGDVLVMVLYDKQGMTGPVTKTRYPRAGRGELLWVRAEDAAARPGWWQRVATPEEVTPDVNTVLKLAGLQ